MRRVEYLMEMFKLLVNFIYLLLSGIAFLIYNIFFVEKREVLIFAIFIGIGVFFFLILAIIVKKLHSEISKYIKEQ